MPRKIIEPVGRNPDRHLTVPPGLAYVSKSIERWLDLIRERNYAHGSELRDILIEDGHGVSDPSRCLEALLAHGSIRPFDYHPTTSQEAFYGLHAGRGNRHRKMDVETREHFFYC